MEDSLFCEQLIQVLEQLRLKLNRSGVERTAGLRAAMGDNCEYYWKSMNVFLKRDYLPIRTLLEQAIAACSKCDQDGD